MIDSLYDFNPRDPNVTVLNPMDRFKVEKRLEPAIDVPISKVVGFKVYQCDPRVLKLVVKWKKGKPQDSLEPDNFLENPKFIEELRQVLSENL